MIFKHPLDKQRNFSLEHLPKLVTKLEHRGPSGQMEIDLGMIKFVQSIFEKSVFLILLHTDMVNKNHADKIPFYTYEIRTSSMYAYTSTYIKVLYGNKILFCLDSHYGHIFAPPDHPHLPCRCKYTSSEPARMLLSRLPALNVPSGLYSSIEYLPFGTIQSVGYEWSLNKSVRKLWLVSASLLEAGDIP